MFIREVKNNYKGRVMGKKKHKRKPGEVSLLSFVEAPSTEEKEEKVKRERKENVGEPGGVEAAAAATGEVEGEILEFISGRGRVSKSELWSWVKKRGLSPASFYRALTKLLREGAVKRVFDEDLEEHMFYVND